VVNRKTVHRIMQRKGWPCRLWHRPARRPKPTWEKCSAVDESDRPWATDATKMVGYFTTRAWREQFSQLPQAA
jgi:hypothetical protein